MGKHPGSLLKTLADLTSPEQNFSINVPHSTLLEILARDYETRISTKTLYTWLGTLETEGYITRARQYAIGKKSKRVPTNARYTLTEKAITEFIARARLAARYLKNLSKHKEVIPQ